MRGISNAKETYYAEPNHHLGYARGAERPEAATNQRSGATSKTVLTGDGKL